MKVVVCFLLFTVLSQFKICFLLSESVAMKEVCFLLREPWINFVVCNNAK